MTIPPQVELDHSLLFLTFELDAKIGLKPAPETSTTPGISTAADVLKSLGTGLAEGAIGVAGLPGDIGSLMSRGTNWLLSSTGVLSPEAASKNKEFAQRFGAPTSAGIQNKIEGATGEFYQPQTTAGEYARTIGQFAPVAVGPGSLARKAAQVAVPAVLSETAGQATREAAPEAEPVVRMGVALAAGRAAGRRPRGYLLKSSYSPNRTGSTTRRGTLALNTIRRRSRR
jgi:hypothetical protein